MGEQALIVDSGRILTARLLKNDNIEGISHCALGAGDVTFTDPLNPPAPTADQTLLKGEFIRKRFYKSAFLIEDPLGEISVNGVNYTETTTEGPLFGVFYRFEDYEAANTTIKEIGFFGGTVAYVGGVTGDTALNGIYNTGSNPTGEVLTAGYLYEVRNIPDWAKDGNTMLEIIAIVDFVECTP